MKRLRHVALHVEAEACVAKEELRATRKELLKTQREVPQAVHALGRV